MTAGHPLRPLVDLGEALNGLAPHNVLASLIEGTGISTTPVLGRQPTMQEEMQRVVPQHRPAPAATAAPQAFDPLAPLNAILAFLGKLGKKKQNINNIRHFSFAFCPDCINASAYENP